MPGVTLRRPMQFSTIRAQHHRNWPRLGDEQTCAKVQEQDSLFFCTSALFNVALSFRAQERKTGECGDGACSWHCSSEPPLSCTARVPATRPPRRPLPTILLKPRRRLRRPVPVAGTWHRPLTRHRRSRRRHQRERRWRHRPATRRRAATPRRSSRRVRASRNSR